MKPNKEQSKRRDLPTKTLTDPQPISNPPRPTESSPSGGLDYIKMWTDWQERVFEKHKGKVVM